jgi:hypothetical protein
MGWRLEAESEKKGIGGKNKGRQTSAGILSGSSSLAAVLMTLIKSRLGVWGEGNKQEENR